jgi:hypothetical protein
MPRLSTLSYRQFGLSIEDMPTNREAARAFLAALTSPAAREKFKAAGL